MDRLLWTGLLFCGTGELRLLSRYYSRGHVKKWLACGDKSCDGDMQVFFIKAYGTSRKAESQPAQIVIAQSI